MYYFCEEIKEKREESIDMIQIIFYKKKLKKIRECSFLYNEV